MQFEVLWLDRMGIDVVRPGSYATACGKGYWECGPDETENLELQWPAINFFKIESAHSFYFYDPIRKAFRTMQISD